MLTFSDWPKGTWKPGRERRRVFEGDMPAASEVTVTNGVLRKPTDGVSRLSPAFRTTRTSGACGRCGEEIAGGTFARWVFTSGADRRLIHAYGECVALRDWPNILNHLAWPRGQKAVGAVAFSFVYSDYEDTPGKGVHEPPEGGP